MLESAGPFLGFLRQALRQRALILLIVALVMVVGFFSWRAYQPLIEQRGLLKQIRTTEDLSTVRSLIIGYRCEATVCRPVTADGQSLDIQLRPDEIASETPPDPRAFLEKLRPALIAAFERRVTSRESRLSPLASLTSTAALLGSAWGVIFAVLVAVLVFGSDWRWGAWRTLLTFEPRRTRLLASKTLVYVFIVILGLGLTLAVCAVLHAILRNGYDVTASGGSVGESLGAFGAALLASIAYGCIAASLFMILRNPAGALVALAFFGAVDGALRQVSPWDQIVPSQAIAIMHRGKEAVSGFYWWPLEQLGRTVCGSGTCDVIQKSYSNANPTLALSGWIVVSLLIASVLFSRRDIN